MNLVRTRYISSSSLIVDLNVVICGSITAASFVIIVSYTPQSR